MKRVLFSLVVILLMASVSTAALYEPTLSEVNTMIPVWGDYTSTPTLRKGLAKTIHQARQLISHGHIQIGKSSVSIPSYMVTRKDEPNIKLTPELKEKINPTIKDQEAKRDKAAPKPRK